MKAAIRCCLLVLLSGRLPGQEPVPAEKPAQPILQYQGQPLHLPFQCTEGDIEAAALTCTPRSPCAVYLELTAIEAAGRRIFACGNLHTQDATLYSVLLSSDDGGKSWTEPHERLRGADFDQIQFYDFESGWISGHKMGALARDPFFLLTTDGGKTWRERQVFSESKSGYVQHFHFNSKRNGQLWVDRMRGAEDGLRYEAFETNSGGENWEQRAVSDKPLLKDRDKGVQSTSAWRIRGEPGSQALVIENRQDERWVRVAEFALLTGHCQTAEVAMPSEPPAVDEKKPEEADTGVLVVPSPDGPAKKKRAPKPKK